MKIQNDLPRVPLAHLPTPLETMLRLSLALGGPYLFIKRDDQTGLAFGGNKTRKLEFLLGEALQQQARTLVTAGGTQSNHCRQTAAAAAKLGLDCILVLNGDADEHASGNLLLDGYLGAELIYTDRENRDLALESAFTAAKAAGREPYLIPLGGSVPVGAAAYAHALFEVQDQHLAPDWIVVASSSGGTQAGLVAGARLSGYKGRILGISIDTPEKDLRDLVAEIAVGTVELLGGDVGLSHDDVLVNADFLGGGYGVFSQVELDAIKAFARHEGIFLDPVYTGRAAGALLALIQDGHFKSQDRVLFWHTGGTPALFASKYQQALTE
jgi:D-cysteine desulfhydrase family pyridoxal phosphate-dependent enzyme